MERDGEHAGRRPHVPAPRVRKLRRAGRALLDLDGETAYDLAHSAAGAAGGGSERAGQHDLYQLLQRDAFDGGGHGGAA